MAVCCFPVKIPVITARVVAVAHNIDPLIPLRQYDKVLVNPHQAIPIDLEGDNKLYIVPIEDIVAIFRKHTKEDPQESDDDGSFTGDS